MAKTELRTQDDVLKLPVPKTGEKVYYDAHERDGITGLTLRVRPSGSRTFVFYYRFNGKQKRIDLGDAVTMTLEDARKAALKHRLTLKDDEDPAIKKFAKRIAAGLTVGKVISDYLETCKTWMKPRSYSEYERYLQKHWKPIHGLAIGGVTRAIVAEQLRGIAKKRGKVSANRCRSRLSACFAWAIGEGLLDQNVVTGIFSFLGL